MMDAPAANPPTSEAAVGGGPSPGASVADRPEAAPGRLRRLARLARERPVFVVLLGVLWIWYTRRRTEVVSDDGPPPPSQSPFEAALARLAALETADLTVAGSEVPYFVELSEAVRMYLELRIGIPALELTTGEVLDEFSRVRYKIPGGVPDQVRTVLGLSDLVKFAEFRPLPADSTQMLGQARHMVERLEEKQRQLALDAARQKEVTS